MVTNATAQLPWVQMIALAAAAVATILVGSYLLRRIKRRSIRALEQRLAAIENDASRSARIRRQSAAFLIFAFDYLTDRKNIAVHAVVFPTMVLLVVFSFGLSLPVRAAVLIVVIGLNSVRMRLARRKKTIPDGVDEREEQRIL